MPIVHCEYCGKEIKKELSRVKRWDNHYCNREHQGLAMKERAKALKEAFK